MWPFSRKWGAAALSRLTGGGSWRRPLRLEPLEQRNLLTTRFAIIGDYGRLNEEALAVAAMVKSWNPEFITTVGDNIYSGTYEETIGGLYGEYLGEGDAKRFFPAVGNHDLPSFAEFFGLPDRCYDFVRGPAHFFMVDDFYTCMVNQGDWLEEGLRSSTAPFQFVFRHIPTINSANGYPPVFGSAVEEEWGADAVFAGHGHVYERLAANGIPYFVNGVGGASLYRLGDSRLPISQFGFDDNFGAILAEMDENSATFSIYSVGSPVQPLDSVTIRSGQKLGPTPHVLGVRLADSTRPGESFALPAQDGSQLETIPLAQVDRVEITFNTEVNIRGWELAVLGSRQAAYATGRVDSGPGETPGTWSVTWRLVDPIRSDQIEIVLDDAMYSLAGYMLDGEWSNPLSIDAPKMDEMPSGDATPGGDFRFRFTVSPADINLDNRVDGIDLAQVAGELGAIAAPGVRLREDIDADGRVTIRDILAIRQAWGEDTTVWNQAPQARSEAFVLPASGPLSIAAPGALANDIDPELSALTMTVLTHPSRGVLSWSADGSFTYTPDSNPIAVDSFEYLVSDGQYTARAKASLVPAQLASSSLGTDTTPDSFVVDEDGVLALGPPGLMSNDSDPRGRPLTARDESPAAQHGRRAVNADGSFWYVPEADYFGPDTFGYGAGAGGSRPTLVTVTVRPVNDAPVTQPDSYRVPAGGILATYPLQQPADVIGPGSIWRFLDDRSDAGSVWMTPDFDDSTWAEGPQSLGYDCDEITDTRLAHSDSGQGGNTTYFRHRFTVPLASEVTGLPLRLFTEDGFIAYLNGIEVARHRMPLQAVDFRTNANLLVHQPSYYGSEVTVDLPLDALIDGDNLLAIEVHQALPFGQQLCFDPRLTPKLNYAPVIWNDDDLEGADLTGAVIAGPHHGQLTWSADGSFRYQPEPGYIGPDEFFYRAYDGEDYSEPTLVQIDVDGPLVPRRPVVQPENFSVEEDRLLVGNVLANDFDLDDDRLEAILRSTPRHGTIEFDASGSFRYQPPLEFNGIDEFEYVVTDGMFESIPAAATIHVVSVNDPPIAIDDAYETIEGQTVAAGYEIEPAVLIPERSVWKYLDDGSDQGTAWRERGFNDANWETGPAELGYGDGDEATVVDCGPAPGNECSEHNRPPNKYITTYFRRAFTVDDPNDIVSLTVNVKRDDGAVVYLNGVEVIRDIMPVGTIHFDTLASSVAIDDGRFFVQFENGDRAPLTAGRNIVAVEIHQESVLSSDISFDLSLDAMVVRRSGSPIPLANDSDTEGDALTAILVAGQEVSHGTLTFSPSGAFTYVPNAGFTGTDTFQYQAFDGHSLSSPARVTITVQPAAAPAPAAVDEAINGLTLRTSRSRLPSRRLTRID
jgi:hypothetical protein